MRNLDELSHHSVPLGDGGEVLVLDTGAIIGPESQAMLGALHSRSIGGIRSHLKVLAEKGSDKFMETFYVGYGHKSIGDLGNTAVFIEGVSMLAAKAIQDFPLYNGQEASTRYIDFSQQRLINPAGTAAGVDVLEGWRAFYLEALDSFIPVLKERYPRAEEENEAVYEKAIKARAFDTLRSFLPAGASTNLVWVGPLRQFFDRLPVLRHHPLPEVRKIAEAAEQALLQAFPNSFSEKRYEETETYHELCQSLYAYTDDSEPEDYKLVRDDIDRKQLALYREAMEKRPAKVELPYNIRETGLLQFKFQLDFGSFRDIQRQRAVTMPMPLLTPNHGFEEWYLQELPAELRSKAELLIGEQLSRIESLGLTEAERQYYLPMGYRMPVRLTGDLRGLVYLTEIRATRFVHPTLRMRAVQFAKTLNELFAADGLRLHLDPEPDRFDVKRGEHDIVEK
jgi:thymidylate synthase ThyX